MNTEKAGVDLFQSATALKIGKLSQHNLLVCPSQACDDHVLYCYCPFHNIFFETHLLRSQCCYLQYQALVRYFTRFSCRMSRWVACNFDCSAKRENNELIFNEPLAEEENKEVEQDIFVEIRGAQAFAIQVKINRVARSPVIDKVQAWPLISKF